jgi:thioredoxin reductase (NADPH)
VSGEDLEPGAAAPGADETFPVLTAAQVARIAGFARERSVPDRHVLWSAGDRNRPLYVVLAGAIAVLSDRDQVVTVHHPGGFSGDVDLLSGRPVVVTGCARGATRVLELPPDRLRALVQTDAELSEILLRAFILRRLVLMAEGKGSVALIGSRHSALTLTLQEFLTRNSVPFAYLDVETDPGVQATLDGFALTVDDVPVLVCRGTRVLRKPTVAEAAACLELDEVHDDHVHDVAVIGAGPAGLAAAVYAASEGLDVLVLESSAPGGQAGSSSRIENYLGFPTGISGQRLAGRAFVQAEKFGAEFAVARTALRLDCGPRLRRIHVGDGVVVEARAVIVATGVQYRKPELPNLTEFEGVGVYYAATQVEANVCREEDVIVVGGGNSAGQAAVFLSSTGRHVHVLVRGPGLAESMSRYLIRRIDETPNITLHTRTEIEQMQGSGHLERVVWRDGAGRRATVEVRHVFLMTGAVPNTGWLRDCVVLDDKGFVKTGPDLSRDELAAAGWPPGRSPLLFETSLPRVFAVGDVRAGSVKRVAAAVGEGSVCVQLVHKALAE